MIIREKEREKGFYLFEKVNSFFGPSLRDLMVLSALYSAFLIAKQAAGIAGILLFHLFSELDYSCSGFSFLVKHRKPILIYLELRPLLCICVHLSAAIL